MTLPFLGGGGGGDSYLGFDFLEGRVTKIFNFALKIKEGGREGGKIRSPPTLPPPKFGTCTWPTNLANVWARVQTFVQCKYFDKLSIRTVIAKWQTFLKLVKCIHFTVIYTLLYALAKYVGF